ncbi:MAG: hypothetical protein JSV33_12530 [bacterium]|nr:MAG: hypothetical protein JSV33_12530 [bacterium]
MLSIGYDIIVTIFIPGAVVFAAIWFLLNRFDPTGCLNIALSRALEKQWLFSLVLVVISIVLGQLLATLMGFIEIKLLDKERKKQMVKKGLIKNEDEYDTQWNQYIDSLEIAHNSYISRLTLHYHFESRLSISLLILSLAIIPCAQTVGHFIIALITYVLGLVIFNQSALIHSELADYRYRKFGKSKLQDLYY